MKNKKVDFIWLAVSCLSFLIFSVSFMIMPFESASAEDGFSIAAHLSGLMFWISLLIGVISQTVLVSRRSRRNIVSRVRRTKDTQNIGMFCFFKNKLATVFDILSIISLIGLIVSLSYTRGIGFICYVFVSALVFSFSMHCILNGRVYNELISDNKSVKF